MSAARFNELTDFLPDRMDFLTIFDTNELKTYAYSLESTIAEKLEAIIRNEYLNSRYKDFYDIYILTCKYQFKF